MPIRYFSLYREKDQKMVRKMMLRMVVLSTSRVHEVKINSLTFEMAPQREALEDDISFLGLLSLHPRFKDSNSGQGWTRSGD